ncbi:enoyl-CoA hydratase/isomerase family protein [Nocardioidaceae bacterium]|nr:enoyl-CoA hydratase/isomerase family protein [Nocardioidaceae bacterium]
MTTRTSTDSDPGVRIETTGAVLRITWDRPDRYNSLDATMLRTAVEALERAAVDPDVRLVTVTGQGKAFCAGASLRDRPEDTGRDDDLPDTELLDVGNQWALACRAAPQLVVSLVNGVAAGIGTSIAMGADLVVMSSTAYLKNAFESIGLMPDGGATAYLPAILGRNRAMAVAVLGDRIDAEECVRLGIAARCFDAETFPRESEALVARLAAGPTQGYAATKRAIDALALPQLAAALDTERHGQRRLLTTADHAEGVAAFLDKRDAHFTGS